MTYNHYSAPSGFNFENVNNANKGGDFFELDEEKNHYNAERKAD
jgi:hypothetical protein